MPHNAPSTESVANPTPLKLEATPTYRDEWNRQHPALSLLYHHDVITHLIWCAVASRYLSGGADGEVKIWKSELSHARSNGALSVAANATATSGGAPARPWLLPERHVMTMNGPITGICVTDKQAGNSEVAVIASTDGTLTLCRTNTGEIVRTLRAARGESIESFRTPAVRERNTSALEAEKEELLSSRGARRPTGPLRSCAADAVSHCLAPTSDLAIVRRRVYTIHAYRDEVRDVFAGPSNVFFQGLRAVAPTYAHLTPQEETVADVLAAFGVSSLDGPAAAAATVASTPRQWYATSVAIAVAPAKHRSAQSSFNGGGEPTEDLYLFLGFPEGLLQVYILPRRWFQLHPHGENRLDPPSLRFPVLSTPAHTAAVVRIEVLSGKDLVVSVSEDGTTLLRRLSALHTPLRHLGICVGSLTSPMAGAASGAPYSASVHMQITSAEGLNSCHSRCVTCCCVDVAHQLLITGSADHTLCWWSLMAGSPSTPIRVVSLRDQSSNVTDAATAAAGAPGSPVVHGGYPVDVSVFYRQRSCHGGGGTASAGDDRVGGASRRSILRNDMSEGVFVLVLDTEQVVRVFDAITGKLQLVQAEEPAAATAASAAATPTGDARVRRNVRLVRYDDVNGADRFLLGGLSLVPWYLTTTSESNAIDGHKEPILFSAWSVALRCVVTADAHHVLFWRLGAASQETPLKSTAPMAATSPHSNGRISVEVLRAWRMPQGIRSIALCEPSQPDRVTAVPPSLVIATQEQPLLMQYDFLAVNPFQKAASAADTERSGQLTEPLPLCQLVLRTESDTIASVPHDVTALAAVAPIVGGDNTQAGASATAAASAAYVCAVCRRTTQRNGVGNQKERQQGCVLMYAMRNTSAGVATADSSVAVSASPWREIMLSQRGNGAKHVGSSGSSADEVVSVLPVPASRLLVLGGRRVLYVTSLFGSTSSATACSPLPTKVQAATSQQCRKSAVSPLSSSRRVTAVFPGTLVCDSDVLDFAYEKSGNGGGGSAVAVDKLTAAVASSTAPLDGYLSCLVHIHDDMEKSSEVTKKTAAPCFILSGSNVGVVQLWDAQAREELWCCTVSFSQEPITALAAHRCAARWLVAVGDQTGVVTVLDLTDVVHAAQKHAVTSAVELTGERRATVAAAAGASVIQVSSGLMVDRWQAHADTVSGVCFTTIHLDVVSQGYQQLVTTGEDASVVAWNLPLVSTDSFGCVTVGNKLFTPHAAYTSYPTLTALPWSMRGAYAKLQERYVCSSLFARSPDLFSAFISVYTQSTENEKYSASEEALLDRAWDVLVADVQALLSPPPHSSGAAAPPLGEAVARNWCVSLANAASSSCRRDLLNDKKSCPSTIPAISGNDTGSGMSSSASFVLAFADRCCGADPRFTVKPNQTTLQQHKRGDVGPASAVRECLRGAVRTVVQASTAQRNQRLLVFPKLATEMSPKADAGPATAAAVVTDTRPATEVFSAVAIIAALARPPVPGGMAAPSPAAAAVSVATVATNLPPLPVAPSAVGDGVPGLGLSVVPSTGVAPPPTANPTDPQPMRRVMFEEETRESSASNPGLAANRITGAATPNHGYRVAYNNAVPLVRGALVSPDAAVSAADGTRTASPLPRRSVTHFSPRWRGSTARGSFASTSEHPFSDCPAGSPSLSGSEDDNDNGDYTCAVSLRPRAAAVVERVHRSRRRRGQALQLLGAKGSGEENTELFSQAKSVVKANHKLTRESNSPYVVAKESYRTLIENNQPSRNATADSGYVAHSSNDSGFAKQAKRTPATSAFQVARPVVADTYLAPALARARADTAMYGGNRIQRGSASSQELSWYALRRLKRDAAEENVRLWNTSRVMRTLMEWTGTATQNGAPTPCQDAAPSGAQSDEAESAATVVVENAASPKLKLPYIIATHTATTLPSRGFEGGNRSTAFANIAPLLPELLCVLPTAAVNAAVRPGLPTHATLQQEMNAMQVRMRQSVQQRAAQHRLQRATAAASRFSDALVTAAGCAAVSRSTLIDGASEGRDGGSDGDDKDGGAGELHHSDLEMPDVAGASASSNDQPATTLIYLSTSAGTSAAVGAPVTFSPSQHPPGLARHRQRRALQSNDSTGARRMATVPLSNPTTRRELFAHRLSRFQQLMDSGQ